MPLPPEHGFNRKDHMALTPISAVDCLARIDHFDAIIDARSEGEYALDHLPGALNWPSLNDEERVLVGTEYKQISPFVARKRGAALVARNVASHIERHVLDKPRDWQPLVYCWRGGQRSGSLALVLGQIGFRVQVVEGGYRAYRRAVMDELESLPERFQFRVRRAGARSGRLGQSPRLGAGVGAGPSAALAKTIRNTAVGCASAA